MKSRNQTKASNPDLERRFLLGAKYGNLPQVQDCWWQNVHPNATGSDGWTALHWASAKGHLPVVQWLVQHGHVNVDAAGLQGETPLHCACQSGQKDIVKYLVQEGHANVNAPAADGRTPFDVAWEERKEEIVQLLSDRPKLQPNFVANSSSSSDIVSSAKLEQRLIAAAQQGHLDHVQECCRRHVNVNVAGRDRWTALHWASRHGHVDMVRCLVHGGKANVELKTKSGWTALHWACKAGHLDVVKVLVLECAADTDATTNSGSTPLQLAKQNGRQDVVTFLSNLPECRPVAAAQRKTDDAPNAKLEQRFLEAAKNGYLDHVTDCWLQGVNVNAQSSDGWMALHSASFKGHLNVVQWLVQHGKVDIEATTNSGWTALHCACQSGQVAVVKYLVEDCGANTHATCMDGKTPFDVAWQKRQLDVVKVLSDLPNDRSTANGSLDLPCTNLEQQFLDAAENGHLDQVIECCQLHVNVNALSSSNGWTALHWAGQKGHLDIVQWLVQSCKLDVDTKGLDGQTPLHCACQTGQLDVVKYLIRDCGAQTEATTADGKTPFDIAWQERKNDVVVYLSDLPTKNPPSTGRSSSIADSSTDFTIQQSLATSENSNDDRARFDEEIANGRMELERMLNNPTAEPTCWSIRYLDDCTDNFNSKVLGEGAFGKVYFGCDKVLGFQFAVKRVPLSVPDEDALNEIIRSFKREISVLKRFRHPNIVALYGFNITMHEKSQCLVYEYVANGALNGFLIDEQGRTRLPGHVRISIMFQVARAVNFLHTGGCGNLKIFHRDIKSGNICLTQDYTAKLIDCGMSKFVPEDKSVSHGDSVTPTILKSSGAAVFGTPGYICPDYAQGDVPFTAACDVYSMGIVFAEMIVGCLQGGQSSRSGESFGNFYRRYINDKYHEKVGNGLEILMNDADPAAEWNQNILIPLSELVLQCLAASPLRRPTTNSLVQKLGLISKADFRGAESGMDAPGSYDVVLQLSSEELSSRTSCILCHESVVHCISCPKMHTTCVPCLEHRIQESIGRSGDGVCCGIVGCNTPFTDDCIYGKISPLMYKEYVTERGRQKDLDLVLKALDGMLTKKHIEVMTSLKEIQSLGQRSLKGLAYLATESVKKCPTLVWIIPAEQTVGRSHRDWIKWAKSASTHRRYHVYFVCQHSFAAVDVEPRIEIDVPRSWMVQAAPVLRLSMFAIRAALAVAGPLPFPFPDILPKEQMKMNEEFVNSFLDDETSRLLNAFQSACTRGIDLPQSENSKLATLTGPAYDGIVEKATKLKRTHWKQHLVPVMNQDGSLIWIKKEFKDLY